MTYFVLRHFLAQTQSPESAPVNPDLARRIEGILADRLKDSDDVASSTPRAPPAELKLSTYEQTIAGDIIHPDEIPVSFSDIGGLDSIISDLQESVIYPLTLPSLYGNSSNLLTAPSGVLLYGPPGCGKTMLAKALAHESGACFINLHISTLTEKWYGDSNKLVYALFSVARKLAPSIIFIDEIDAVLGTRRMGEHEASAMVKAEFMTLWDGLTSATTGTREPQRILVLGATNRIHDIDEAILRRMPKRFAVGLPDGEQRKRIFKLMLKETKMDKSDDEDGNRRHFDMSYLVKQSTGMSGSDIREACREAAMVPVREFIQHTKARGGNVKGVRPEDIRGLRTTDFFHQGPGKVMSRQEEMDDEEYYTTDDEDEAIEARKTDGIGNGSKARGRV